MRRLLAGVGVTLAVASIGAGAAWAAFPYGQQDANGHYHLPDSPTNRPNDLQGKLEWMYSASVGADNAAFAADPRELNGIRGAHVVDHQLLPETAFETTTGRPDVTIAVLDSGIKWNDGAAMSDLRKKTRLNRGEVPVPQHDLATSTEPDEDCATYVSEYDANGDGAFNVVDYSCDSRVPIDSRPAGGVGPPTVLDPQDVLIAFSLGGDDDDNGFVDDIVGWDFLDDDNDPFDDVQYGHGTGEARDSSAAEAITATPWLYA